LQRKGRATEDLTWQVGSRRQNTEYKLRKGLHRIEGAGGGGGKSIQTRKKEGRRCRRDQLAREAILRMVAPGIVWKANSKALLLKGKKKNELGKGDHTCKGSCQRTYINMCAKGIGVHQRMGKMRVKGGGGERNRFQCCSSPKITRILTETAPIRGKGNHWAL